ncbi:MAG: CDP-diacylglycerol--serine O-phosphatidyltransferase [Verrucomicrobia bacterium GWC2_42_7]|nr:MAG: CDP-diacylglycerol--serine O-phosphatidyltransferase [Verrucomicrobia bacterium GWC2_42_7]
MSQPIEKKGIRIDPSDAAKIYLLPNLFTSGNLFFGFLAIIRCIQAKYVAIDEVLSKEYYTHAVWFIILASVCDVLDGRVARLGGKESLFGKEFDSLADLVSFGVAPALMVFFLILSPTDGCPFFRQLGWLIGFFYLLCGAVRLARYNVITHPLLPVVKEKTPGRDFVGLPITAAAGTIASLVLVLTNLDLRGWTILLPPLMLLIAWLMVSTVPYPSFRNIVDWNTDAPSRTFVSVVALVAVGVLFKEYSFAVIFLTYLFYGFLSYQRRKFREKRTNGEIKGQK